MSVSNGPTQRERIDGLVADMEKQSQLLNSTARLCLQTSHRQQSTLPAAPWSASSSLTCASRVGPMAHLEQECEAPASRTSVPAASASQRTNREPPLYVSP